MKTLKREEIKQAKKASSSSPKILTLQEELNAMQALSLPYINLMMITGTLTAENFEMLQLQLAAENGFTLMMTSLLTTGKADVNRADSLGGTALDFATQVGKDSMVALLKKYGAVSGRAKESEVFEDSSATEPGSDDDEAADQNLMPLAGEEAILEEGVV